MDRIIAQTPSISELLTDKRYRIDYYQREYRWESQQARQLLDDLFGAFLESYEDGHERIQVEDYGQYFLGPIIVNRGESDKELAIVDGQQRITTLTLLLIALRHRIQDEDQRDTLARLVVATRMGQRTFTLDVDTRASCMEALFAETPVETVSQDPSVRNIIERFGDVEEQLDGGLDPDVLPYFADWLMYRVMVVEVIAASEVDAYTIFETMNDRGLRLTSPEMLRGYMLSQITSPDERKKAGDVWKTRVIDLSEIGKEEDVNAIQAWLRGRYAESASQYRAGVAPGDYERIGNEFHRWVRDMQSQLGLDSPADFVRFICTDFNYYAGWYARLRRAAETETPGLETVKYIGSQGFTLQYALLLAALHVGDGEEVALRKVRATAAYIDILIHRRLWNSMRIGQTYFRFPLFELARKIRAKRTVDDLVETLTAEISANDLTFAPTYQFVRHRRNGSIVRRILARLTLFVEQARVGSVNYTKLLSTGRDGYDIEHVLADKPEQYVDEFNTEEQFAQERNLIGGLLLIPSSVNRSYGDLAYKAKRKHYLKENLLAASLHEKAYDRNPPLRQFVRSSGLALVAHRRFGREELYARQELYQQIATQVWRVERIATEAGL